MEKIQVTKSSMPPIEEYIEEIKELWNSHWLTNMGAKHSKFQEELCQYLGVRYVELLSNGHMALELTLQALDLKGEVITTPFTFASTTHAIVRSGLQPVFCDIDPITYTIDTNKIESLITDKTCAILPVHVYGNICDVEAIERIANKYNLRVLYDAAHTFGEKYKERGIGTFGDASIFSFHATKVFNSIEGGAVCYNDIKLGEKLYSLKNFGIRGPESVIAVGANAKMNEFCAAMGICNLRYIDSEIEKRKKVYERYMSNFKNVPGIKVNEIQKNVQSNYAYFPIIIEKESFGADRDTVFNALNDNNICARKYFYPLTNSYECYRKKYSSSDTPVAERISNEVLTLPMYSDLSVEEIDRISEVVLNVRK